MSYSEWADFVYYDVGGIASFSNIVYQALLANRGVVPTTLAPNWQVLPAPAGAGVSSLSTLTGAITQSCVNGAYTTTGNNIELTIAYPVAPVQDINGLTGFLLVESDTNTSLVINTFPPSTIQSSFANGSRGIFVEGLGGSPIAVVSAPACQIGWVVIATYIHSGGGGGSQYIKSIVTANGSFTITCNTNIDIGDTITWFVVGSP